MSQPTIESVIEEQLKKEFQDMLDSCLWRDDEGGTAFFPVGNIFYWWINKLNIAISEERTRCVEIVEKIDYKEIHLCRFNDGEQNCECYLDCKKDIIKAINTNNK